MNFRKSSEQGHFQYKNLCCKIWTFKQGFFGMKIENDTKGVFQGMCFNNSMRKIKTGHIGKQDTFDPPPPFGNFPKNHPLW